MARSAAKPKRKLFYATIQATRVEEWFVEAENAEEARAQHRISPDHLPG